MELDGESVVISPQPQTEQAESEEADAMPVYARVNKPKSAQTTPGPSTAAGTELYATVDLSKKTRAAPQSGAAVGTSQEAESNPKVKPKPKKKPKRQEGRDNGKTAHTQGTFNIHNVNTIHMVQLVIFVASAPLAVYSTSQLRLVRLTK